MNFVSYAFVALFVFALLVRLSLGQKENKFPYLMALLGLSLLFYSWHVPWYLFLLVLSAVVDYYAALKIAAFKKKRKIKKRFLYLSLFTNLGLLGFFKYYNFGLEAFQDITGWHGQTSALALPIGISFYTFQSMSYSLDVYRGKLQPISSFPKFLLYVSFFPQLVAGPIVRARDFLYQMDRRRRINIRVWGQGFFLIIQGFFFKMVLADNFGRFVDKNWDAMYLPDGDSRLALLLALFFSCQIFCDFSGYSRIARGLGYLLGFKIPQNFNSPYIAGTFSNFWQRWHISLSQWLRDYLYVSLGGSKKGRFKTYRNLLLTMLLGGLWHGAAYNYIIWGGLHGFFLAIERALGLRNLKAWWTRFGWFLVVQAVVLLAWVFFRCETPAQAQTFLQNLFALKTTSLPADQLFRPLVLLVPMLVIHLRTFFEEKWRIPTLTKREKALLAGIMLYFLMTAYGVSDEFIYFQF